MTCHGPGAGVAAEVSVEVLAGSAHAPLDCQACHVIASLPHPEDLPPVDCGECHEDEARAYRQHGVEAVGPGTSSPTCAGCHGTHGVLPSTDPRSPVHPRNLPATCGRCHEDPVVVERQGIRVPHPTRLYRGSVHGLAAELGDEAAASCNDCHSTDGSAHVILPPGDPRSTISRLNIPRTCGRCHRDIQLDYARSIHGQQAARGEYDAPVCISCHGEHGIMRAADPRSPVSPARVAEATCSPCHESAALNEKYSLPGGRLRTFVDSYHGLKSRAGDLRVANCASCHGEHLILPASDPRSTVNPHNLERTCGTCHPGISAAMASVPIHRETGGARRGIAGGVRIFYLALITLVIGAMVVHWLLDLVRQIVAVLRERPAVRRMRPSEVVQHAVLALSFTALVISGFALRFYDAWWSHLLFGREGGFARRGEIHRLAAVVMIAGTIWHCFFLLTGRGRRFFVDMWPRKDDFRQFFRAITFNLGRSSERPLAGRFTYVEKAEYWALVWGTAIMCVTGLILWFDNWFVRAIGKGTLDVVVTIHYYEAWLAFLAILVWHMYATVFRPQVYPMNPAWLTGKMPLRMYEEEHPLAPPGEGPDAELIPGRGDDSK